jgi:hypothetical protein
MFMMPLESEMEKEEMQPFVELKKLPMLVIILNDFRLDNKIIFKTKIAEQSDCSAIFVGKNSLIN